MIIMCRYMKKTNGSLCTLSLSNRLKLRGDSSGNYHV